MIRLYVRGNLRLETPIRDHVVLGRQRSGEPEPFSVIERAEGLRVVVARRSNQQVSRAHLRIDRDEKENWVVSNCTRNCVMAIDPGRDLLPGKQRVFDGTIRLQIDEVNVVIDANAYAAQLVSLGTPNNRFDSDIDSLATSPVGQSGANQARPLVATFGSHFDSEQRDCLLDWLRMIAQLFRHVDTPPTFVEKAVISIQGIIGANTVLVLNRRSEFRGPPSQDTVTLDDEWSVNKSVGFDRHSLPAGLSLLLARMLETRQTVLLRASENPSDGDSTNQPSQQMIATPVLDTAQQPIAAFVAIRESMPGTKASASWGEIEASLLELVASGCKI